MKTSFINSLSFVAVLFLIVSCNSKNKEVPVFDRSYSTYISSFTSGIISKKSSIRVALAQKIDKQETNGILTFEPDIEGGLRWIDDHTLEFLPSSDLKAGQVYVADLNLSALLKVPDSMKSFEFGFQVIHTNYDWGGIQLKAEPNDQMQWYALQGEIFAADEEDLESVSKLIEIEVDNRSLKPEWVKGNVKNSFSFKLDSIKRRDKAQEIKLKVSRSADGTKGLEDRKEELLALGDFRYSGFDIAQAPERMLVLKFSDPLKPNQNLNGLRHH